MTTVDIIMVAGGVVLFATTLGLVIYGVTKKKPYKALLVLFPLAVLMIGFPEIRTAKIAGLEIDKQALARYAANPNDQKAVEGFKSVLTQIDTAQAKTPEQPLPPQVRSNLLATVDRLKRNAGLSSESQVALSHAQWILGLTNDAARTLHAAVKADTNVVRSINPRMRFLLAHPPQ